MSVSLFAGKKNLCGPWSSTSETPKREQLRTMNIEHTLGDLIKYDLANTFLLMRIVEWEMDRPSMFTLTVIVCQTFDFQIEIAYRHLTNLEFQSTNRTINNSSPSSILIFHVLIGLQPTHTPLHFTMIRARTLQNPVNRINQSMAILYICLNVKHSLLLPLFSPPPTR